MSNFIDDEIVVKTMRNKRGGDGGGECSFFVKLVLSKERLNLNLNLFL